MINYLLKPYNNIVNNVVNNNKRFIQEKPDECPICYEFLENVDENLLECGHWFHYQCIINSKNKYENLNNLYRCPLCRKQVEIEDYTYKNISTYLLITYGVLFSYVFISENLNILTIEKLPNICEYIICHLF